MTEHLQTLHDQRMLDFKDWRPEDIQAIQTPSMIIIGDSDIVCPEHAAEMFQLLHHAQLAVLPGPDHMALVQRVDWQFSMIEALLKAPMSQLPEAKAKGDDRVGSD